MKHMTRHEALIMQLLHRARTIGIIGASPYAHRHSHSVVAYLHNAKYDVIPIRPDGQDVCGLKSYARIEDVPGPIDIAVIFRRSEAAPSLIRAAAVKGVEAVWLPPGVSSLQAEDRARADGIILIKDRCIEEEHRHASVSRGHPRKLGVHIRRRRGSYEDNRKDAQESGYVAGGGGGSVGGGGTRAILDEKKMVAGRPSPRRGRFKPVN